MKLESPARLALDEFWMPFTANRQFKAAPRLLARAEGMHFFTPDGRAVLDGTSGLWCVNAGHARREIVEAIALQAASLDYAPPFQMAHPLAFDAARVIADLAPAGMRHVFFTNSGSESADTAIKMALAYQRARGEPARRIVIGRERGYHGVNVGGTMAGGIPGNRKAYGALMAGVDHLRSTHDPARNAFSRGVPAHGAEFADELERLIALHDASNIAALIVEPLAGSAGVLVPPAGYLERLREITARHGIVLIFDEVITAFGRLGAAFAAQRFGVTPELITCAKGINNAAVPMGAVIASDLIHDAILAAAPEGQIEFLHGYTYSAHPLACAALLAAQKVYADEALFARARAMEPGFESALHGLADARHVIDVRNLGLVGGIELAPRPGAPGRRGYEVFLKCFEAGVLVRYTGDTIALSPPLIIDAEQIEQIVATLRAALAAID